MTTDERIERLTERHEALTESVQLLKARTDDCLQMIVSIGRDVQRLIVLSERLIDGQINHEQRIRNLEARM